MFNEHISSPVDATSASPDAVASPDQSIAQTTAPQFAVVDPDINGKSRLTLSSEIQTNQARLQTAADKLNAQYNEQLEDAIAIATGLKMTRKVGELQNRQGGLALRVPNQACNIRAVVRAVEQANIPALRAIIQDEQEKFRKWSGKIEASAIACLAAEEADGVNSFQAFCVKRNFDSLRALVDEMAKEVDDDLSALQSLGQRLFPRKSAEVHWKRASDKFANDLLDAGERFYDRRNRCMKEAIRIAGRVINQKRCQQMQRLDPTTPSNKALITMVEQNQKLRGENERLRARPAPGQKWQLPADEKYFSSARLAEICDCTERNVRRHAKNMEDAESKKKIPCKFPRKGEGERAHRDFRRSVGTNEISVEDFVKYLKRNNH